VYSTTEPLNTTEDVPFTKHEIQAALEKFDPRKAPGEDAINSEVLLRAFRNFPTFFYRSIQRMSKKLTLPKLLEKIYNTANSETGERRTQ
jgi:hypothetical protein